MKHVIQISGMSCGGCVASVERAIKAVAGVSAVAVVLADQTATVEFDEASTSQAALEAAIEAAGYDVLG